MTDRIVTPADLAALRDDLYETILDWANDLPASTTVPPAVDFTPKLTVDVTTKPGSALLDWTDGPSGTPNNYIYQRSGKDTVGSGPWTSPVLSSTVHSAELDKLVPGMTYGFTVMAVTTVPAKSWQTTVTLTIPKATVPVDPPQPGTGAVLWSSGVWCNQDANQALAFEKQRGQALGNIMVYTTRKNWDAQLTAEWIRGIPPNSVRKASLVIKIPLWTEDGDNGSAADWRLLAQQIASVDPNAWVCLAWEMNLPSWYYKLTATNFAQWVSKYRAAVMTMKLVAPGLRFAWNPNVGSDQAGGDSRAAFQQLKDLHHAYGIDSYDLYPADISTSAWTAHLTARGFLGESFSYALANGMQFILPEWGVASGTQWGNSKGFDNPRYINDFMGFLKSKQALTVKRAIDGLTVPAIGFETYFSEPDPYLRSDWASNPKAAAAYAAQFKVVQ